MNNIKKEMAKNYFKSWCKGKGAPSTVLSSTGFKVRDLYEIMSGYADVYVQMRDILKED